MLPGAPAFPARNSLPADVHLPLADVDLPRPLHHGTPPLVRLKALCGPGDDGSPCITVMMPDED
jgi:hypothetical protein